jgi:putative transposase
MSDHPDRLRLRLLEAVMRLPDERLGELAAFLASPVVRPQHVVTAAPSSSPTETLEDLDWPHSPPHRLSDKGTFIVTAGTCHKEHYFRGKERLDLLQAELLSWAKATGWQLEAWAVFSNHYHFVAHALDGAESLGELITRLHGSTSTRVNELDGRMGRQVWFNFWDTELTYEASYLARLAYVHQNPVKHGLVRVARDYRWCSSGWYERTATPAQVKTLSRFKTDKVKIDDDFVPVL